MQIHYNLANGTFPDRTSVRIKTVDTIARPVSPWFMPNLAVNLQPKQQSITTEASAQAVGFLGGPKGPGMIIGVRAHMHGLGVSSRLEKISVDATTGEESRRSRRGPPPPIWVGLRARSRFFLQFRTPDFAYLQLPAPSGRL